MQHLGNRIKALRLERGMSQEDLVARMQLRGHSTLTQPRQAEIEHGRRDVSAVELISYARILGVPISELLGVPDYAAE